jgi:hypothetical protein
MAKALDVLIHHSTSEEVIRRLQQHGFSLVSRLAVPGYLMRSPEGVEVDVLFGRYPWLSEAFQLPACPTASPPVCAVCS